MSDRCALNFRDFLQKVLPQVNSRSEINFAEIDVECLQFELTVYLAMKIFNIQFNVIKKCFPKFLGLRQLDFSLSYNELLTFHHNEIHSMVPNEIAAILQILLYFERKAYNEVFVNWPFVVGELQEVSGAAYLGVGAASCVWRLSVAKFKPQEVKRFKKMLKKSPAEQMSGMNFTEKFKKYGIDLSECDNIQSFFKNQQFDAAAIAFLNFYSSLVLVNEARNWGKLPQPCNGECESGKRQNFAYQCALVLQQKQNNFDH